MEKILIVRLSSIGDIVQASAVPRLLKTRFPGAEIHWLVRADNQELVEHNPFLTKIIAFDRSQSLSGWLRLCRHLNTENYTHLYDAHNNLRSFILRRLVRVKLTLVRSKNRFKRFLLFYLKLNLFGLNLRGVDSYINPLRAWGVANDFQGSQLFLPPTTYEKVRQLIPPGQTWLAVAPATAWAKKTWPENYWKNLIGLILNETSYGVVILGGPKDNFCKNFIMDSQRVISLQGKLSLLESAAATSFCKTLIAGDTGLLHMAESLQKDVVGILGPTPFGHPVREKSIGLQSKLWCQPCSKDGSGPCLNRTYQNCMVQIQPPSVLNAVRELLGRSQMKDAPPSTNSFQGQL